MDVSLDLCCPAGRIPVALAKCLRCQLSSTARQKKRHVIQVRTSLLSLTDVLIQSVMVAIHLAALCIEEMAQQLCGRGRKADELDPPSMTPLAECLSLLKQASGGPVAQAEPH